MNWNPESTSTQRMWAVLAIAFIVCTLIVLGSSVGDYARITMRDDREVSLWRLARWPAVWWYGWALLSPFFFELAWRIRVSREAWLKPVGLLVAGLFASFLLHVAWQVASMYLPAFNDIHPDLADAIEHHVLISLYLNVFIYGFIVAAALALRTYETAQLKALRASELETELTRARLDALKGQLHPHFLFNALNGISTLMYRDVRMADRMITRLSTLLRRALDRADAHEWTLNEEVELLHEYLAIEQLRFGDRLHVQFDVEPGLDDMLVPSFVFQPLVENSIKHAIKPQGNAGSIVVRARSYNDRLQLSVSDDGPGLAGNGEVVSTGVGLSNLHDRLSRLYEDEFRLAVRDVEPSGLSVDVTIPMHRSSAASVLQTTDKQVVTEAYP